MIYLAGQLRMKEQEIAIFEYIKPKVLHFYTLNYLANCNGNAYLLK
jgi:hypothetical protein